MIPPDIHVDVVGNSSAHQEAELIRLRLNGLLSRHARALSLILIEGHSVEQSATFLGVTVASFEVLLFRAAKEYCGLDPLSMLTAEDELTLARALSSAVKTPDVPGLNEIEPLLEQLNKIRTLAFAIKEQIQAAEKAEELSERSPRKQWVRRAIFVALLALTAFLFQNSRSPS